MRKIILALALASLPLSACTTLGSLLTSSPSVIANSTKLDEQFALTANLAYKGWVKLVEVGIVSGQIKGTTATKIAALDNELYSALQTVDAAYASGNSANYLTAYRHFQDVLAHASATVAGAK